ncbi:hypothetical protein [Metallosphaera javensis (ex Sakai et al. 2022)]|uniref:hypothetical protein n=1 Tax=Metallosphaera javensis (ex Sakai et al. 2022) TaxID=2775498 RepID=UPI00258E8867
MCGVANKDLQVSVRCQIEREPETSLNTYFTPYWRPALRLGGPDMGHPCRIVLEIDQNRQ